MIAWNALQSLFLACKDVMLFMSQSRLHLLVIEPVIYLAGLLDSTDLSVYFVAVIQCPLVSDGLIHSVLFACFFLISKQLQTLFICLSHMLSRGFGHSSVMRVVMHSVLCTAYLVLSQVDQVLTETFSFFPFISQTAPLISVCTVLLQVYQQLKQKLLASHVGVRKAVSCFNSLLVTLNFMTAGFSVCAFKAKKQNPQLFQN